MMVIVDMLVGALIGAVLLGAVWVLSRGAAPRKKPCGSASRSRTTSGGGGKIASLTFRCVFPADGTPRLEVDSDIRALQSKENGFMLSAIHALAGQLVTSAEAAHESIDCGEAFRFGAKFGRHYIKSHTRSGVMICPASKAPHEPLAGGDAKGAA